MGGVPRCAGGLAHGYCLSAFQAEFGYGDEVAFGTAMRSLWVPRWSRLRYGDEVAYTVTVPAALDTACGNDTRERNTCDEWFSRLAASYSAPS